MIVGRGSSSCTSKGSARAIGFACSSIIAIVAKGVEGIGMSGLLDSLCAPSDTR